MITVLVPSCDAYADVWGPFFSLFFRYWPDCPHPILLGTNGLGAPDTRVSVVQVGADESWSHGMSMMLSRVDTPYVLVMLEDFFLRSRVHGLAVETACEALRDLHGGYLRLKAFPRPDHPVQRYPWLGEIAKQAPYRAALQAALWRVDTLLSLLKPGESAWDFEGLGSWRSNSLAEGFYSTWSHMLDYFPVVTKGKWVPPGVAICRSEGLTADTRARSVMTRGEALRWRGSVATSSLINRIPWRCRRRFGDSLRRVGLLPEAAYRQGGPS
jgi:hypothetical protein